MRFVPAKIPYIIKRIFPNYVWDFSSNKKILYLTFDDGPTPEITQWTLNTLKKYNAKATFFCIGNNVIKYPDIIKNILEEGHSIGNHTQDHVKGWKTSTKNYLENVLKAETIIKNELKEKQQLKLYRPPFGQLKNSQGKAIIQLGYKIIMWSVISFDWEHKITKAQCLENVISKASKKNNIIVFHDSVKASRNMMYALPKVLEHFSKEGYVFKAIPSY
ncbi:peptidoglycan/xylan/chitin deacetylase (PgdA/CDA1 family) [Lacinutrix venerupis]|uniref:polysaccharide deacetylase family protein n=1 Tax=Lacinutrix venerupis TaxID=1486034 RepID=UPI000EB3CC30|nr:polysaccharide deacetylase family protein [Lacinutrix venerupis]RLJ65695.1 peptidoglycan/xylan/chitin deacetylase (PgdA/CDA1 family) [Lacinutrix venerupis]